MHRRFSRAMVAAAVAACSAASAAHAINHTTEYRTNLDNYRTCTDPLLGSCTYPEILSPSRYYFTNGSTTTVIHKDDGTVQLRIDAGGLATDDGISYACASEPFACVGGHCAGGRNSGGSCTIAYCIGGTNNGGACSAASACPGGTCNGGSTCNSNVCHGGLQNWQLCGNVGDVSCTSVASSTGWAVVFRGNEPSITFDTAPTYHFRLIGDDDVGCMKACSFSLGPTGAINSNGLTCSTTSACGDVDSFHYVELRDPDGEVVGIPAVGAASILWEGWTVDGDPAKHGDCSHPQDPADCP